MNEQNFSGKSGVYSKSRPDYPQKLIEFLFDNFIKENSVIADIGAGTGIFTKQLSEFNNKIYAIEPNDDMFSSLKENFENSENVESLKGAAEALPLPDKSVDFICAAQSFHWFDKEKFKAESGRILKENGFIILIWNVRDEETNLVKEIDLINRKYCKNYKGFSSGLKIEKESFSDFFSGEFISKSFRNDIPFTLENFIKRNLSSSFSPTESDENYSPFIEEIENLARRYEENGIVTLPNITKCFIGKI